MTTDLIPSTAGAVTSAIQLLVIAHERRALQLNPTLKPGEEPPEDPVLNLIGTAGDHLVKAAELIEKESK